MLTDNLQLKDDQYKEKANKTTNNKLDRGHWIVTQYRGRGRRKKKEKAIGKHGYKEILPKTAQVKPKLQGYGHIKGTITMYKTRPEWTLDARTTTCYSV